ncbi:MAG: acetylglutamate kinase [Saprospiraceae bacterium]|nr:acetylglutamate kinase [Saprospiraceae bacterium]
MKKLHILKIGGNIIDNEKEMDIFLDKFHSIHDSKILIHGGGKIATDIAERLGIQQHLVDGRRITDAETLKIITMVYGGLVNKNIVSKLQSKSCNAIGLSGADGNLVRSEIKKKGALDYGFVGVVAENGVNTTLINLLINNGLTPVICPITHDQNGNLLNTNADSMATAFAINLAALFDISLTFCFEKNGVLEDIEAENSIISILDEKKYMKLKENGIISKGMLPKLENAFDAAKKGVQNIHICHALAINATMENLNGTKIIL